jgi:NAD(P)H-dependent FMN reductase
MTPLLISASLNPASNSRLLALEAQRVLAADGLAPDFLDLRELALPPCDGDAVYQHPHVERARGLVAAAGAILAATPVYNYDANAALKNLVELTGRAWEDKVVGFLCAAGGDRSYMSILGLANSLMLDFRCVIVPRFVYATDEAFAGGRLADAETVRRVAECARATVRLARATQAP